MRRLCVSRLMRRFSTMTDQAASDFSFLMSLVERPRERHSSMTPERWPDILVRSQVMVAPSPARALPAARLDDGKESASLYGRTSYNCPDHGWKEAQATATDVKADVKSLEQVVNAQLHSPSSASLETGHDCSIDRIQNILGILTDLSYLPVRSTAPQERYFALVDSITFHEAKSKSLVSVLAKAFDFDPENVPDSLPFVHSNFLASTPTPTPTTGGPLIRASLEPSPMKKRLSRMIVLAGEDLHLVKYGQLQRLASLYGLAHRNRSRRLLEKSLCKYFTPDGAGTATEDAPLSRDRISVLTPRDTVIQPMDRPKHDDPGRSKLGWDEEQSGKLMLRAKTVLAARLEIAKRVEAFLVEHNLQPTAHEDADVENLCVWEVVAKEFPGMTPKACQKRWMLIHRLECMGKGGKS